MKTKRKQYKFDRYIFGILLAMEVIMSFTFLGYIHIPPISITTAYIPIVVSASLFGPVESTVTGLLFGLGSMYKASASAGMSLRSSWRKKYRRKNWKSCWRDSWQIFPGSCRREESAAASEFTISCSLWKWKKCSRRRMRPFMRRRREDGPALWSRKRKNSRGIELYRDEYVR